MFNKLKLVALLMVPAMAAGAKEGPKNEIKENLRECIVVNRANEGWFMGPAVGTQMYVGDSDNRHPLGYRLSTALEGHVGKWITPAIAVRLRGTAARITGGNLAGKRDARNMVFMHADGMMDIMSVIKGVDENRKFALMPFVGVGAAVNGSTACFSLSVGAQALFRIHEKINLFTELKGALLNDKMDGCASGFPWDGSAILNAGFIYNF